MATGISFWYEVRRAAFQWLMVAVAAIVSGVVLSELLLRGWTRHDALIVALIVGVALTLPSMFAIARSFSRKRGSPIKEPVSVAIMNVTGEEVCVYTFQPGEANTYSNNRKTA